MVHRTKGAMPSTEVHHESFRKCTSPHQNPRKQIDRSVRFAHKISTHTESRYTTKILDRMVHLNNDAVQKQGEEYGKFETGNKLSLEEFQKFLDEHASRKVHVREELMPKCHALMADAIRSAAEKLNVRKIKNCFEVFGFDFMVDAEFRVWLIECNANPCLDLLDQALRLTVDSFTGENGQPDDTKWELLYDSLQASPSISSSWLETLPAGFTLPMLGREILGRKGKKGRVRSEPKTSASLDSELEAKDC
eukprot:g13349.t1